MFARFDATLRERQTALFETPGVPARPKSGPPGGTRSEPLSVGELTERIGRQFALSFPFVSVVGEVSQPQIRNGHLHFVLRDDRASLRATVWADRVALLSLQPKEGMRVIASGAIRLYEKGGTYSLRVDRVEQVGAGDLQRALEALRAKLRTEGLLDPARKRPLPLLVGRVGLVTSPTGAVRHDIEATFAGGQTGVAVYLCPARVQGETARHEIAAAIDLLGSRGDLRLDAVIVARGGGSAEELLAFNDEGVARAIARCPVPVISAVGHETDVTIADLIADVRSPTPTAAAAMIVERNLGARKRHMEATRRATQAIEALRSRLASRLGAVSSHRVLERERGRLFRLRQRVSQCVERVVRGHEVGQTTRARRIIDLTALHGRFSPSNQLAARRLAVARLMQSSVRAMARRQEARVVRFHAGASHPAFFAERERVRALRASIQVLLDRSTREALSGRANARAQFASAAQRLEALSPLSVLTRGFAIATKDGAIVRRAADLSAGNNVVVRVSEGAFAARVTEIVETVERLGRE